VSALEPGWYKATVRGVPDVTIVIESVATGYGYAVSAERVAGGVTHNLSDVTDARPLIVLDLVNPRRFAELLRAFDNNGDTSFTLAADQIEAQTKPPRIPEPGLWGVVEAGSTELPDKPRRMYIHTGADIKWSWIATDSDETNRWTWDNLADPTLIRDGIEP